MKESCKTLDSKTPRFAHLLRKEERKVWKRKHIRPVLCQISCMNFVKMEKHNYSMVTSFAHKSFAHYNYLDYFWLFSWQHIHCHISKNVTSYGYRHWTVTIPNIHCKREFWNCEVILSFVTITWTWFECHLFQGFSLTFLSLFNLTHESPRFYLILPFHLVPL